MSKLRMSALVDVADDAKFIDYIARLCSFSLLQIFWNAGCQMVALNFQTLGKQLKTFF